MNDFEHVHCTDVILSICESELNVVGGMMLIAHLLLDNACVYVIGFRLIMQAVDCVLAIR